MMSILNFLKEGEGQRDGYRVTCRSRCRLASVVRDGTVKGTTVGLPATCTPLGQAFCTAGPLHSIVKGVVTTPISSNQEN